MQRPAQPVSSQGHQPFSKPFFLRIKHVRYAEDPQTPNGAIGPDFHWRPSSRGRFVEEICSDWWIWDPGQHAPEQNLYRLRHPTPQEDARRRTYRTSTMIWDPERHGYIHVPFDCTTTGSPEPHEWRRLSFGRHQSPNLARVAVLGHQREQYQLHLPGPNRWFEQLLPDVCRAQMDGPQLCLLAGHLSLLVALVAFSAAADYDCWAVDQSFRHDVNSTTFRRNNLPKSASESTGSGQCFLGLFLGLTYDDSIPETSFGRRDWTRPGPSDR